MLSRFRYELWYLRKDHMRNGVRIIVDETLKDEIMDNKEIDR